MKGIFKGQNAPLGFMSVAVSDASVGARKFQRAFPGFGTAVAEERAVEAGDLCELLSQLSLKFVIEKVRGVDQPACLLVEHLLNCRMRVPERIHANAAEEIEIAFAG